MICKWCNQPNPENNKFCMHCGKELTSTDNFNNNQPQNTQVNNSETNTLNNNIESNAYSYNLNQNNYQSNTSNQVQEEKANVWLAILSWFIPLAGLIIFLVKKDKQPKTAKVSGICALISFILNIVIVIITIMLFSSIANSVFNSVWDEEINNTIDDMWSDESNVNNDLFDNSNEESSITATNDWKKYEIIVNDTTLTLPATYNDIKTATNASMKSADEKSYLASNYYTLANMYKNDKLALYIQLTNNSDNDLLYSDCQITRVSQTKYQVSQGADVIIFPGDLKAGEEITESKIIELFGTPYDTDEYSSDSYESKTYKYVENTTWTTTNNYEITVVNGIIDELQLDNRN